MVYSFFPGAFVRHPHEPDWGVGQIQSVDNHRITVNFENSGKQLINAKIIELILEEELPLDG
tara:strand:+ start:628 stop:813 length:186 start_codon:yes stop_codon:yes gene_type:complete